MKKISFVSLMLMCVISVAGYAVPEYTLEDYLNGKYGARGVNTPRSMPDGEFYSRLSSDGKKIIQYAWKTGKVVDTIFNVETARECAFEKIGGYEFSKDAKKILIYTDRENIYRRSFKAVYHVYDRKRNLVESLSTGKQQMATFSPDGRMIAFVRDNNIYLKKLDFGTESAITKDGEMNKIINGLPDWVYEEEFATNKSFEWSPDNEILAFIRYDESRVKEFSFDYYGGMAPVIDDAKLYPQPYKFKYPKSGEDNSTVSVHAYNVNTKDIKKIDLPLDEDGYIPRIKFTPKGELAIFTMNRRQNVLNMYYANPRSAICRGVMKEENEYYIEAEQIDQMIFTNDNIFTVSEKDGYNHIYMYTSAGNPIKQVTKGEWDVMALLGYDETDKVVYYESAEGSPLRRAIYKIDAKGNKIKMTPGEGMNRATFSSNFKYYQNTFSNVKTPPVTAVYEAGKNKELYIVEDNKDVQEAFAASGVPMKEFFTFTNKTGETINGWMIKPPHFDTSKKYPVWMTQYSGPNSQSALDQYGLAWEHYLACEGYIIICVDGRGTGARGEAFRKSHTYMSLGTADVDDQIAAARYMASLSYVDAGRIGIWGWSYGGFMTLMCLSKGEGIFKVGISVAPPTKWEFYDTIYTERYMRTPKENKEGYEKGSPFYWVNSIKGNLLLVHGTADDNVHFQNSIEYSEALVQSGFQFRQHFYTNRNHNIYGGNTRKHLYTMMSQFVMNNL